MSHRKPQKNVGFLIPSFLPNLGGIEVGMHNIALRVTELGWNPIVFAPYEHVKKLRQENWQLPYSVHSLPPRTWGLVTRAPKVGLQIMDLYLRFMQKRYAINFWHVTMGYPTGCAIVHYAMHTNRNVQYLIRCAGEDIQKNPEIDYGLRLEDKYDKIISKYIPNAQRVVAITPSVYKEYRRLGIEDNKIHNVPNGVDINRFALPTNREKTREKFGVSPDEIMILCVGRNHPKKNYKTLLMAGEILLKKNITNFKIVCVGNQCSALNEQVKRCMLNDFVVLIDGMNEPNKEDVALPVDSLIEIYKAADVFAFPSFIETFGVAIIEAMAAGLPVIVGDSEGSRDIVEGGKWGLMFNPNDPNELASKIVSITQNQILRNNLVKKSLKRAEHFDWDIIVKKYVQIYDTAIKQHH